MFSTLHKTNFIFFSVTFISSFAIGFKWNTSQILLFDNAFTLSSIYAHFNTLKKKRFREPLWKKVKLLNLSNFTLFYNVFYAISILKSCNSHILAVVCIFFNFWIVSKWCTSISREWVKDMI